MFLVGKPLGRAEEVDGCEARCSRRNQCETLRACVLVIVFVPCADERGVAGGEGGSCARLQVVAVLPPPTRF